MAETDPSFDYLYHASLACRRLLRPLVDLSLVSPAAGLLPDDALRMPPSASSARSQTSPWISTMCRRRTSRTPGRRSTNCFRRWDIVVSYGNASSCSLGVRRRRFIQWDSSWLPWLAVIEMDGRDDFLLPLRCNGAENRDNMDCLYRKRKKNDPEYSLLIVRYLKQ